MNYGLPSWYIRAFSILVISVASLVVIGGSVRIMDAGLACPDWPLCFGELIPDFHPRVYFEFIHRVVAGVIGIATFILAGVLFIRREVPTSLKLIAAFSLIVLLTQIILGGLTVLWQLKAGVVASHLALGTGFFALLYWMFLELRRPNMPPRSAIPFYLRNWSVLVFVAIYGQIILGGLVASNYAALACTDFPTCQGQWIPTLEGPVGLHVIHRLGAYTVGIIACLNFFLLKGSALAKQGRLLLIVVFVQIGLGIANVIFYIPPMVSLVHLAVGLKLLYLAVRQMHAAICETNSDPATGSEFQDALLIDNRARNARSW